MESRIIEIDIDSWQLPNTNQQWIKALEAGKVLYFPRLAFDLKDEERSLLTPTMLAEKARNISLSVDHTLKGAAADEHTKALLCAMIHRFRQHSQLLVHSLLPKYQGKLRLAPTSYRPIEVKGRKQSLRADDRRLHVDAFPSRPNYGERILRVFSNINPEGADRVWRLGEPFETMAETMLPRAKRYSKWQASLLAKVGITKSLRSEYDHLMLQLHDRLKADSDYQKNAEQLTKGFAPGSVWMCFSDQALHGVKSGQYMLEQTFHISHQHQYNPDNSPLGLLQQITGKQLA